MKRELPRRAEMMAKSLAAILLIASAGLASAEALDVDQARQFVAGKLFEFTCFEGSHGAGRIYDDGSVAGTIQIHGAGPTYSAALPIGTIRVEGQKVCASLKGIPFEPCFELDRTGNQSFHGSLAGLSWAYCDFARGPTVTGDRLHPRAQPLSLDAKRY